MAQTGQRVAEYVLDNQLGAGAFAQVWRAHHHVWVDQLVAVKIPSDPQCLRSLQGEGAAIRGLVHPNIVRALGFDPYAQVPYLIMEYIPGMSLRPLISQRNFNPDDAVAILRQMLAGLQYAHERGVVHRDIKPENILVHDRAAREGYGVEGVVKLTDFGLGKAAGDFAQSIAYSASLKTPAAREIAGTLDYMAPEQRGGDQVDGRADLYACGAVLYEMLTGDRPAGTELPSERNPAAPRLLDEIFKRSYARLDRRYGSAAEFLSALRMYWSPAAAIHQPPPIPGANGAANRPAPGPGLGIGGTVCPQCRQPVEAGDQFCMHCGVQLVELVRRCRRCGAYPDPADRFCIFCGDALEPQAAQPAIGTESLTRQHHGHPGF